jgi:hypothetical protein
VSATDLMGLQLVRQRRTRFVRAADMATAQRRQTNWGAGFRGYNANTQSLLMRMPGGNTWSAKDVGGGAPGRMVRVSVNNQAYARTKPRGRM